MPSYPLISCLDREGKEEEFAVEAMIPDPDPNIRLTRVRSIPIDELAEFFELTMRVEENGVHRIVGIFNNKDPRFIAKGIPESLLSFLVAEYGIKIESSPTRSCNGEDWRTRPATKMWHRIVRLKLATYDCSRDVFTFGGQTIETSAKNYRARRRRRQ